MVSLAAVALLIAAIVACMVFDHSDELRDFFGFSDKTIVPPLSFGQWTVAALLTATGIMPVVIFGLGLVNAMHRLSCNARSVVDWVRR